MTTFLPYHCPTFRTDHLLEPCKLNMARVKALKEGKKHCGPIEICVECKGKALITKPRTVIEGLPAPENWVEERFVNPGPEMKPLPPEKIAACRVAGHNLGKKYKKKEKTLPELPQKAEDSGLLDEVPRLSAKKEVVLQDIRRRSTDQQEEIVPKLPKIEDIGGMDPHFTGEMSTEEYIRDMRGPKQEEPVPAVRLTGVEGIKVGIVAAPEAPPADMATRYCPKHPKSPQRIDKLGRWMGMCDACLAARGREAGVLNAERGVTAPPIAIPLNLPQYSQIKEWLEAEAEENERKLTQQIMFILKVAWRQGT